MASRRHSASRSLWLRLALRAYPRDFRLRFGHQLARLAEERLGADWNGSSLLMFLDLVRCGFGVRWDDRRARGRRGSLTSFPDPGSHVMESSIRDLWFALRTLRKQPIFTLVAIVSLALGIGANTAIFGIVDAALLSRLPVRDPGALSLLHWVAGPGDAPDVSISGWWLSNSDGVPESSSFAHPHLLAFRERAGELADFVAFADLYEVNLRVGDDSALVGGQVVDGRYYGMLGVRPAMGRLLQPDDDRAGAPHAAVLTHRFWATRFGGDPAVVGSTIAVNGVPFTVVGVSEPGFSGTLQVGGRPDITIPLAHHDRVTGRERLDAADTFWLHLLARRAPTVTPEVLAARLNPVFQAVVVETIEGVDEGTMPSLRVVDGSRGLTELRSLIDAGMKNLLWVVGLILLIACANLANLLLARSGARRREIAVRLSLGARRGRLVRQLLTESLLLAALGGIAGVALAHFGRGLFLGLANTWEGMDLVVSIDGRVLAFASLVSLATGLLFGTVPALWATRVDLTPSLRDGGGREATAGGRALLASKGLMALQVGMSILLLVVAGLFVRNLTGLVAAARNFDPEGVLIFSVNPSLNHYEREQALSFYEEAIGRVRAIPGVERATYATHTPVSGNTTTRSINVLGYQPGEDERLTAYVNRVGGDFFETFQIPLLAGRRLGPEDMAPEPRVAVVNERFSERYFPGGDVIGGRFGWARDDGATPIEIVGVVADVHYQDLDDTPSAVVHVPPTHESSTLGTMTFAVRSRIDRAELVPLLSGVIVGLDPDLPIYDVRTMVEQRNHTLGAERQFARIASLAAGLALLLASVGLYGILSYSLLQRRREIGVRMALGAEFSDVLRLVGRELVPVGAGIALGVVASFWVTRLVESQLHEVSGRDPYALGGAVAVLAAVAAAAAWLPARRAATVSPVRVLREE